MPPPYLPCYLPPHCLPPHGTVLYVAPTSPTSFVPCIAHRHSCPTSFIVHRSSCSASLIVNRQWCPTSLIVNRALHRSSFIVPCIFNRSSFIVHRALPRSSSIVCTLHCSSCVPCIVHRPSFIVRPCIVYCSSCVACVLQNNFKNLGQDIPIQEHDGPCHGTKEVPRTFQPVSYP